MSSPLGNFEQILLFAVLRCGDAASGAAIRDEVKHRTGRWISPGAIYTALSRLEERGFVTAEIGGPAPSRGGRRKKFYHLAPRGAEALETAYDQLTNMARGVLPRLRRLSRNEGSG